MQAKPIITIPISVVKRLLLLLPVCCTIVLFLFPPIKQDEAYHNFIDNRTLFSIANFWNVASNLFFIFIGAAGIYKLTKNGLAVQQQVKAAYYIFFTGVLLVAFASAYYHLRPNNLTLVWDRAPMTISFVSLLSFTMADFVSVKWGRKTLLPLVLTGLFSILYWLYGELHGAGDLRPYALVQFVPIVLLLILFLMGKPVYTSQWGYWWLLAAYIIAKLAEHFDAAIYNATAGAIAGHLLKHLLTAAGLYLFMVYLERRRTKA